MRDGQGHCHNRYGMASATVKEEVFFFGGFHNSNLTNDLIKYSPFLNSWTYMDTSTNAPAPRELTSMVFVNNSSLLIYGGINLQS